MAEGFDLGVKLNFGGLEYHLRPEFRIVAAIEAVTNQPCAILARKCYGGYLVDPVNLAGIEPASLSEIGAIIYTILRLYDSAKHPSQEEVGQELMENGYLHLREPLGDYLSRALRGHKAHEAHARAEAARREAEAAGGGGAVVDPQKAA